MNIFFLQCPSVEDPTVLNFATKSACVHIVIHMAIAKMTTAIVIQFHKYLHPNKLVAVSHCQSSNCITNRNMYVYNLEERKIKK